MYKLQKSKILFFVLSLSLFCFADYSYADTPNIESVGTNETFSHGQSVTISGSGFGEKTQAAPSLWDTVDNQPLYSGFANGTVIDWNHNVGGSFPYDNSAAGANTNTTYCSLSDDQRSDFSTACYKGTDSEVSMVSRNQHEDGGDQLYIAFYLKLASTTFGNESNKWIRGSMGITEDRWWERTFTWWAGGSYIYDSKSSCSEKVCGGGNGSVPEVNSWTLMEAYFDNVNYEYTIKMNGVAVAEKVSWAQDDQVLRITRAWIIGRDGGGWEPSNFDSWLDDIYIDNTFQHIVIGNASTYSACRHLEIQPATAWNSNGQAITATVNQGSFADDSTAYLYVIDSDGAVNETGYPITFGSSGSSDTTAPNVPSGLSVN